MCLIGLLLHTRITFFVFIGPANILIMLRAFWEHVKTFLERHSRYFVSDVSLAVTK